MTIVLVGTGNVAFVLSQLLVAAGHLILEVHGRNEMMRHRISHLTGAEDKKSFSDINTNADVCLLAVSDSAIAEVASQINAKEMLVVHTSGATSKEVLNCFDNYGVLYPLQSLRKESQALPAIPFFIDANSEENIDALQELASSTGNSVTVADDAQRLHLHLAAVLCSNFTNHLYALTEAFCRREKVAFNNLLPLISETANRLQYYPAAQMQTGPAIRHDDDTIHRHLALLQNEPALKKVYELLTESIQTFAKQEK